MRFMMIGDIACRTLNHLDQGHWQATLDNPATLILPEHTQAKIAASMWQPSDHGLIVTMNAQETPSGVLSPNWFLSQWSQVKSRRFKSLGDAVRELEQDPAESSRNFHHEWLTLERVDLYLCPKGHYVSSRPCPRHKL